MTTPMPAPTTAPATAPVPVPPTRARPGRRTVVTTVALTALAGLALSSGPASAGLTGGGGSYALSTARSTTLQQTEVVRWDPCTPIGYRVNIALGGRRALADVQGAVARLSAASGLSFRYLGSTTAVPGSTGSAGPAAPLVIAWARSGSSPTATGLLGAGEVGRGGWSASATGSGHLAITSGYVVVRAGSRLAVGFGPGVTRGRVLLHELGHAVGLEHVRDTGMVMAPAFGPTSPAAAYQPGDVAGLRRVGRPAGCFDQVPG